MALVLLTRTFLALGPLLSVAAHAQNTGGSQPKTESDASRIIDPPQSSLVYARDGSLIAEIGREWRTLVRLRSLPKYVPDAFVAVEDQRFYQHDGVDLVGVAGALKDALGQAARG